MTSIGVNLNNNLYGHHQTASNDCVLLITNHQTVNQGLNQSDRYVIELIQPLCN